MRILLSVAGLATLTPRALAADVMERISVGPRGAQSSDFGVTSTAPVSSNGRFIAFESIADNLVAGDANGYRDIFLRDRRTGTTTLVSHGRRGLPANGMSFDAAISADG